MLPKFLTQYFLAFSPASPWSTTESGVLFASAKDSNYQAQYQPFNLYLQYVPAFITYPQTQDEVSAIVSCAASCGIKVQAKSGGLSYGSFSSGGQDGSLVVDLRYIYEVSLDTSSNIAKVGSGARVGNMAVAIQESGGRALPHSAFPGVGVGGQFTHGGYGFTSRAWGLALDTIVALDIVLANGTLLHATQSSNPDLFWACRGACNSFGIVTFLYMQTLAAPAVITNFNYDFSQRISTSRNAANAVLAAQNFAFQSSQTGGLGFQVGPGKFKIVGQCLGTKEEAEAQMAPLLQYLPVPDITATSEFAYLDSLVALSSGSRFPIDSLLTPLPELPAPGSSEVPLNPYSIHDTFYAKSLAVYETAPLTSTALTAFFDIVFSKGQNISFDWYSTLNIYGGLGSKVRTIDEDATAYGNRKAISVIENYGRTSNMNLPFDAAIEDFVSKLNSALKDNLASYGADTNYVDANLTCAEAHELYFGKTKAARLQTIKKDMDPEGVFWNPQSSRVEGEDGCVDGSGTEGRERQGL